MILIIGFTIILIAFILYLKFYAKEESFVNIENKENIADTKDTENSTSDKDIQNLESRCSIYNTDTHKLNNIEKEPVLIMDNKESFDKFNIDNQCNDSNLKKYLGWKCYAQDYQKCEFDLKTNWKDTCFYNYLENTPLKYDGVFTLKNAINGNL